MKKLFLIFLCVCFCFMAGCENETQIRVAHLSNITGALSTEYAVKVCLDNDQRLQDKYVDLQIKADKDGQILTFGEEMQEQFTICLPRKNYWYNLTYLLNKANGLGELTGYQKYEDFGNRVFMFSAENEVNVSFRVVAGEIKTNPQTNETILVLSEDISKELNVLVKNKQ